MKPVELCDEEWQPRLHNIVRSVRGVRTERTYKEDFLGVRMYI